MTGYSIAGRGEEEVMNIYKKILSRQRTKALALYMA
jgi:hypothetical protein